MKNKLLIQVNRGDMNALAREFGVSRETVRKALQGKTMSDLASRIRKRADGMYTRISR